VGKVKLEVNTGDSGASSAPAATSDEEGEASPSPGGDVIFDLN
jgi:hypothetical protein